MSLIGLVVLALAVTLSQAQRRGNPCEGYVCENDAPCTFPADAPFCRCLSGFYGDRCENVTSVKAGRCDDRYGFDGDGTNCNTDFECPDLQKCCWTITRRVCTDQIIFDPCDGFCDNGASCSAPADKPICTCLDGFSGERCQTKDILVGVCGGVFCNTDADCGKGQTCSPSPCGGSYCSGRVDPPVSTEAPQTLTCANVLCNVGFVCRHIMNPSTCKLEPRCITTPELGPGADNTCKAAKYSEAILVENVGNPYTAYNCRDPDNRCSCPGDSVCVDDPNGKGSCCRGQTEKFGECPVGNVSVCGGQFCQNDYECPDDRKCCFSACGGKLCTPPAELCGDKQCQPDEKCLDVTPPCPPGRFCPLYIILKCVPTACEKCPRDCVDTDTKPRCPSDPCGGCPKGQVCKDNGIQCIKAPCPSFSCVDETPSDPCGGCPKGQVCKDNGIRCIKAPCPSFSCVDETPSDPCGGCPDGQVCKDNGIRCITTPCPSFSCFIKDAKPCTKECPSGFACEEQPSNPDYCKTIRGRCPRVVDTCVPIPPETRKCRKTPLDRFIAQSSCNLELRRYRRCTTDRHCPRSQKCCLSDCGNRICR